MRMQKVINAGPANRAVSGEDLSGVVCNYTSTIKIRHICATIL